MYGTNLIIIADCHRKVELDLFLGTEQDRRISLKEIDLLLSIFSACRAALVKEIKAIEAND